MNDFGTTTPAARGLPGSVSDLVAKRYRNSDTPVADSTAPALKTILSHRSVRHYLPGPLAPGVIELLAAAAQSAPTTSNLQAYSIVAVEDAGRKARLAELAAPNQHIIAAPLLLLFVADLSRLRAVTRAAGRTAGGLDYVESFLVAAIDAALAAEAAIIAAESIGLGTCLIGGMRNYPAEVAAEIGLPPEAMVVFGLTVGVPDLSAGEDIKPRLPQHVVLHRERYQPASGEELDGYNTRLRTFQAEQSMPLIDWTVQAANRIGTAAALKGRSTLAQTLRGLGFGLK